MSRGYERTLELLKQLIASKKNLADTLVSKGEEAEFKEPFDDLVQKAADYLPKTYILVDEKGNEVVGTLVEQQTVFDATPNDVREGKVFASELGMKTGEKVIPSYNTTEGIKVITVGSECKILLNHLDKYDFTKLQVIICPFNSSLSDSVAANKVSINGNVYEANSAEVLSTVEKNDVDKTIELGITNDTDKPLILRYFTYKEIY